MLVPLESMPLRDGVAVARDSLSLATGHKQQVSAYGPVVRDSDEIDRALWAGLLGGLLRAADLTPEQAGSPTGPVPAYWRTIRRWLNQETGVSVGKVRDVCRSLGYPPARALVEVGWLQPSEVGVTGLVASPAASTDPLVRKISASLAADQIPITVRSVLRRMLTGAYDGWLEMHDARPPRDVVPPRTKPTKTAK